MAARTRLEEALATIEAFREEFDRRWKEAAPNVVELRPDKDDPLPGFEAWFRHRLACLAGYPADQADDPAAGALV